MVKDYYIGEGFEVSTDKLQALGMIDPYSSASLEVYRSGKLTSDERLYFTLWGSRLLEAVIFKPQQPIASIGHSIRDAFFVVRGKGLAVKENKVHRFGPGAVIGVAEAIAGMPHSMTFVAVTSIEARKIDVSQIVKQSAKLPNGLKGIVRTITMRTLGLTEVPEVLR